MHATAPQFLRFMQMLLAGGTWEGRTYFAPATLREMLRPQSAHLPHLSEAARREDVWGLGWRHLSGRKSEYFGDLPGWCAYGHAGATGTVVWNDPESGVSCVLFGNHPESTRFLGRVSNALAAALHESAPKPI
jgi:CubicO group peptidase (beta-lactamase class C family)